MGCHHSSRGRGAHAAKHVGSRPEKEDAGEESATEGLTEASASASTAAPPSAESSGAAGDGEACVATLRLRVSGLAAKRLTAADKSSLAVSLVVEVSEILGMPLSAIADPDGNSASARVAVRGGGSHFNHRPSGGFAGASVVVTLVLTLGGGRTPASLAEAMGQESISTRLARAVESATPPELRKQELNFEIFVSAGAPARPKARDLEAPDSAEDQGKLDESAAGSSEPLLNVEDLADFDRCSAEGGCGAIPVMCGGPARPNFFDGLLAWSMCSAERTGRSSNEASAATLALSMSPRPLEGEVLPPYDPAVALEDPNISEASDSCHLALTGAHGSRGRT